MPIELYIMAAVWLLIDWVCRFMLKRNLYQLYMKKENGRVQLAEIKKWRAIYYTRPVRYEVIIEYMTGSGKKTVTITTSSSFLKKYKDEKSIQIVTVPGTNFVFLAEEKWIVQNIELWVVICVLSIFIVILLLIGFLQAWSMGMLQGIIYLSFLLIYLKLRHIVRPRTRCKHKARMKYVTDLSCEEVMEKLRQEAHNDFQFVKEKEDVKDNMYIFSIDWKAQLYQKYLRAGARYRVMVTPSQTGSTVWFYLSECSDDYALDQFAERLRIMRRCGRKSWKSRFYI